MIHAELTIRSVALEMDTKVNVLLPEDRHQTVDTRGKKYPVLYILHGYKEDCSSWLNLSNIFLLCRDLDLIVVMPSANNSSYTDMVYGQAYYTWISEELPVKLKNYFPITDDPEKTFIMGESMGGYGTLRIALGNPEKYGKAVCLSGSNMVNRMDEKSNRFIGIYGNKENAVNGDGNLENLVQRIKRENLKTPEFMFMCGTDDFVYEGCKQFASYMKKELPDTVIKEEYWPGLHNFFFWNQANPKALKFFGFDIEENSVI